MVVAAICLAIAGCSDARIDTAAERADVVVDSRTRPIVVGVDETITLNDDFEYTSGDAVEALPGYSGTSMLGLPTQIDATIIDVESITLNESVYVAADGHDLVLVRLFSDPEADHSDKKMFVLKIADEVVYRTAAFGTGTNLLLAPPTNTPILAELTSTAGFNSVTLDPLYEQ
jgi:hypothetical protein